MHLLETLRHYTFLHVLQQRITVLSAHLAQMDTHAETRTKRVLTEASLELFFFLFRRARSQSGHGGSYVGPHGAGRVQNHAFIMTEKIRGLKNSRATAGQLAAGEQHHFYQSLLSYICFQM